MTSSAHSSAPTVTQCCSEFKRERKKKRGRGKSASSSKCWNDKRQFTSPAVPVERQNKQCHRSKSLELASPARKPPGNAPGRDWTSSYSRCVPFVLLRPIRPPILPSSSAPIL